MNESKNGSHAVLVHKGELNDAAIAADLKRRLIEAYQPILALCDEARAAGFEARIGSGLGPMGKEQISAAQIIKVY